VLFRPADLRRIADGEVTLAFRRWERARVKPGSRLKTAVGVLEVTAVDVVDEVSDEDARAAGFSSPAEVHAVMRTRGAIHRVALHLAGPDPRIALRATPPDEALIARLDRMGPWTYEFLQLIADRPEVRAGDLAEQLGRERLDFKRDVRKLKELGLTVSLNPGYRLSPRGEAVLRDAAAQDRRTAAGEGGGSVSRGAE
jgi:hypothetical protein